MMRLRKFLALTPFIYLSSFSYFTFLLLTSALPVHSAELTLDNFKSTITSGVWFIEHFSPYCGHCRKFAPTWDELVEYNKEHKNSGVQLAQVNCALNGDLCDANKVKGYPQMNLYKDGEFVETFEGARSIERLKDFLKKYDKPDVSEESDDSPTIEEPPIVNPTGTVLVLGDSNFQSTLYDLPAFVKFYAPWCGHCKKLAPVWKKLAQVMQNKLTIAEIDCEAHKSLCKSQKIEGFPTLVYFTGGSRTDYNGGRKLEQLRTFAEKASGAQTKAIKPSELESVVLEEKIVYALLYPSSSKGLLKALVPLFAPLLGSPVVHTVRDPPASLSTRFIPNGSTWALVAFKDHDFKTPSTVFFSSLSADALAASKDVKSISQWLEYNKLPTTIELTQDTFQSIMNAPSKPLVVLTGVTDYNKEKVEAKFEDIAKTWRQRTKGPGILSGTKGDRQVIFAWMDLDRWRDWMKGMYGITKGSQEVDDLTVVIADHQVLKYYDTDVAGDRLKMSSDIFRALEAVGDGRLSPKNSENFVERMARYLNEKLVSIESFIVNNLFYTFCIVLIIATLVFMVIRNLLKEDPLDRDYYGGRMGNVKGDRLD